MRRDALTWIVMLVAVVLLAPPVLAQQAEEPAEATPGMPPEMMEAWAKAATPGEPHRRLAEMTGDWNVATTMWMAPGAPPVESSGSATFESILGGRVVKETFRGDMMGQPFTGISFMGYDNVRERYWSTWFDDMGTGIMVSEGEMDADGNLHLSGEMVDPLTGSPMRVRMVTRKTGPDTYVFEWYEPGPDGAERKGMEIVYTRR